MYMLNHIHFTATEARQRFFDIFRLVEDGKEVLVNNNYSNVTLHITRLSHQKHKDINGILATMKKHPLTSDTPEKMKETFVSRFNTTA